jgi:hypothetical protein
MTADGRKTLTDSKFIVTTDGEKFETMVDGDFDRILDLEFHIRFSADDYRAPFLGFGRKFYTSVLWPNRSHTPMPVFL